MMHSDDENDELCSVDRFGSVEPNPYFDSFNVLKPIILKSSSHPNSHSYFKLVSGLE
jgi:hypothetical protein